MKLFFNIVIDIRISYVKASFKEVFGAIIFSWKFVKCTLSLLSEIPAHSVLIAKVAALLISTAFALQSPRSTSLGCGKIDI